MPPALGEVQPLGPAARQCSRASPARSSPACCTWRRGRLPRPATSVVAILHAAELPARPRLLALVHAVLVACTRRPPSQHTLLAPPLRPAVHEGAQAAGAGQSLHVSATGAGKGERGRKSRARGVGSLSHKGTASLKGQRAEAGPQLNGRAAGAKSHQRHYLNQTRLFDFFLPASLPSLPAGGSPASSWGSSAAPPPWPPCVG